MLLQAQKKLSADESLKIDDTSGEQANTQVLQLDVTSDKDRVAVLAVERETTPSGKTQRNTEQLQNNEKDAPSIPATEPLAKDVAKHDADHVEVPGTVTDMDSPTFTSNGELLNENASDVHVEHSPLPVPPKEIEIVHEDHSDDAGQIIKSEDADVSLKIDIERSETQVDPPVNSESPSKEADVKVETPVIQKKQQEHKDDDPPTKVQDQLEEAQGLLKTAISTGQSKEARLARVSSQDSLTLFQGIE